MKKIMFSALVLGLFAFSSCKKDYTCECTTTVSGQQPTIVTSIVNGTKSEAKSSCENGSSSAGGFTINCVIK